MDYCIYRRSLRYNLVGNRGMGGFETPSRQILAIRLTRYQRMSVLLQAGATGPQSSDIEAKGYRRIAARFRRFGAGRKKGQAGKRVRTNNSERFLRCLCRARTDPGVPVLPFGDCRLAGRFVGEFGDGL
jgi:hypothetical protein